MLRTLSRSSSLSASHRVRSSSAARASMSNARSKCRFTSLSISSSDRNASTSYVSLPSGPSYSSSAVSSPFDLFLFAASSSARAMRSSVRKISFSSLYTLRIASVALSFARSAADAMPSAA
eukprot:29281-Pelagococcus_subviridis.AAC.3